MRDSFHKVYGARLIDENVVRDKLKRPSFVQYFIKENGKAVKVDLVTGSSRIYKLDYTKEHRIPLLSLKEVGISMIELNTETLMIWT